MEYSLSSLCPWTRNNVNRFSGFSRCRLSHQDVMNYLHPCTRGFISNWMNHEKRYVIP